MEGFNEVRTFEVKEWMYRVFRVDSQLGGSRKVYEIYELINLNSLHYKNQVVLYLVIIIIKKNMVLLTDSVIYFYL